MNQYFSTSFNKHLKQTYNFKNNGDPDDSDEEIDDNKLKEKNRILVNSLTDEQRKEQLEFLFKNATEFPYPIAELSPFTEPRFKNRMSNKLIKVGVYEARHPRGRILGPGKEDLFRKALFQIMREELLFSETKFKPKFVWSQMIDCCFKSMAVGESSAYFLKTLLKKMPPPWPGAKLYAEYQLPQRWRRIPCEAFVPGEAILFVELFQIINEFNEQFFPHKWHKLGFRPLEGGHVYTLGLDVKSFEKLKGSNGFIPYRNSQIEFRVLDLDNVLST